MPQATLQETLQELHADDMIRQADVIHDWPNDKQRREQAMTHVRLALWEQEMGRISEATKYRIYSILNFVMPDDGAYRNESTPLEVLEKEAAWELAYQEQLERQRCESCGDGCLTPQADKACFL